MARYFRRLGAGGRTGIRRNSLEGENIGGGEDGEEASGEGADVGEEVGEGGEEGGGTEGE